MAAESSEKELRESVARACRILGAQDVTRETRGHVSARVPGTDRVLIRARGPQESGVRFTPADDVITVDLSGKMVDGPSHLKAPRETFIHTWVYRSNPKALGVAHVHPPLVVLLTICQKKLLPLYGAYDPMGLELLEEGIPLYDSSVLIENDELGSALAQTMDGRRVCLMRGHGIATAGGSVEEATIVAIKMQELAQMSYRAYSLGGFEPISESDRTFFRNHTRAGPAWTKTSEVTGLWRYYSRLADG